MWPRCLTSDWYSRAHRFKAIVSRRTSYFYLEIGSGTKSKNYSNRSMHMRTCVHYLQHVYYIYCISFCIFICNPAVRYLSNLTCIGYCWNIYDFVFFITFYRSTLVGYDWILPRSLCIFNTTVRNRSLQNVAISLLLSRHFAAPPRWDKNVPHHAEGRCIFKPKFDTGAYS